MSCAIQSTGQMQCKVYDSLLQLDGKCPGTRPHSAPNLSDCFYSICPSPSLLSLTAPCSILIARGCNCAAGEGYCDYRTVCVPYLPLICPLSAAD
ncbi:hypothetical protein XELAEV_18003310mg [Xenopus laevis]|uniref:Uncharacterized protein n=1 Tax=Xenopus laevis TaxID=8355 RepID=A0A974BNP5_XENLA|nr:hypothetical protein XELAEV_18003310mg [Xenopus laevis]